MTSLEQGSLGGVQRKIGNTTPTITSDNLAQPLSVHDKNISTSGDSQKKVRSLSLRALRGLEILQKGNQITRVDDSEYSVASQSGSSSYNVQWQDGKWICECADYKERRKDCKHIFAVDYFLRLPDIILANSSALIVNKCSRCGSTRLGKRGRVKNKTGSVQVLYCKDCGKRVQDNALRSIGGSNASLALIALDLHFKGVSVRNIANHFYQVWGMRKAASTIEYWIGKFSKLAIDASKHLALQFGDKWLADEFFLKEKGIQKYVWNVLDFNSRKLIASVLLSGRGKCEAVQALTEAINNAGKTPKEIVSDGLIAYKKAIQELDLKVDHTAGVGIRDKANNNRIERMHNTMRNSARVKRGVKNAATFSQGFRVYYNLVMPHMDDFRNREESMKWIDLISTFDKERIPFQTLK